MKAHQATANRARLPIGVPMSSPRSVSITGVNGWFSANQRSPTGIESGGTKPLPRNGRRISGMGRLLALSTLLPTRPSATDSQEIARVTIRSTPAAAIHSMRPASGAEADRHGDADDDRQAKHRLDRAAEHMPGQHRGTSDPHRAETGDDALGHVHRDRDR